MQIRQFEMSDLNDFLSMAQALWPDETKKNLENIFVRLLNTSSEIGYICRKDKEALGFIQSHFAILSMEPELVQSDF